MKQQTLRSAEEINNNNTRSWGENNTLGKRNKLQQRL